MAFTGDALLIRGCGRTDFQVLSLQNSDSFCYFFCFKLIFLFNFSQGGDAGELYKSVHTQVEFEQFISFTWFMSI